MGYLMLSLILGLLLLLLALNRGQLYIQTSAYGCKLLLASLAFYHSLVIGLILSKNAAPVLELESAELLVLLFLVVILKSSIHHNSA